MNRNKAKAMRRQRRHMRVRRTVTGTPAKPRLAVYKSLKHIYAQVIDDLAGRTIAAASTTEAGAGKAKKSDAAAAVGARLAEKARAAGVSEVVFDRGGFRFHGRIKALADAARKGGMKF